MFGGVKLKDVLAEYRRKNAPWTSIDLSQVDTTAGLLSGLSMPAVKDGPRTQQQKDYAEAAKMMRRCRKLIAVIEKYEKV